MFDLVTSARRSICGAGLIVMLASSQCSAATFKVLYSFTGKSDGGSPNAALIMNANDLYGTTDLDNIYTAGTVFELAPDGTETVLHTFQEGSGGFQPGGLLMDGKGNLWGTTLSGGTGIGVIFRINPTEREKLVHTFQGAPKDGAGPFAAMVLGNDGAFYGTTVGGGKDNEGAVFNLTAGGRESLFHSFGLGCGGNYPFAGLLTDASGNFYGVDEGGGAKNSGTIFKLDSSGRETVLYAFKGSPNDGGEPDGVLIADQAGNFYGTLRNGGQAGCDSNAGCGAVFKLAADGTEKILHFFTDEHGDGGNPIGGVIADGTGNLFGTTLYGGGHCAIDVYGCGTVFRISPDGTETILHTFSKNNGHNGAHPAAALTMDISGNLYGTASQGGKYGYGTVFEITP